MTSKHVDLIYEGVKYSLNCCQAGPRLFTVTTIKGGEGQFGGGGKPPVEAQCRPLADGGYLLVIAGKSQARSVSWCLYRKSRKKVSRRRKASKSEEALTETCREAEAVFEKS